MMNKYGHIMRQVRQRLRNGNWRFSLVSRVVEKILPEYRLTWPELEWFYHKDFNDALTKFGESKGFNAHRRLMLQQLLRLIDNVPGDTAECGVFRGLGSYLICRANQCSRFKRAHHIFDSFEGLSQPTEKDGTYWHKNALRCDIEEVRDNLKEFERVYFYKGWIPERFAEVSDKQFAFVHIDVDLYQPTLDSISFFYERLSTGGIVICDDYGFMTCPGATEAIDSFLRSKKEKMIYLPGGGGFFIKGVDTVA